MDFKKSFLFFIFFITFFIFITGCSEQEKSNVNNTYYIELVNFNHDSLKQSVAEKLFGKVAFYKNNTLEVLSVNYLMEDYPDMHFFKNAAELTNDIKPETRKIRIEFGGTYTPDSISYSLQKYSYRDKKWIKTSDMGFIKATNTYYRAKQFSVDQYGKQISKNTVEYSYN
jgi:hypothetical protein